MGHGWGWPPGAGDTVGLSHTQHQNPSQRSGGKPVEVRAQFLTLPGQGWEATAASDADISPPGRVTPVMLETRVSQDHRDRR